MPTVKEPVESPQRPLPCADADLSGHVLSCRYRLIRLLGRGGMGGVYLAQHVALDRLFAVKVLDLHCSTEKHAVQRFVREARATSLLRHDNIVDVFDFGISGGRFYLVMEYLEGEDLAVTLRRDGPMPWRRVARVLLQVCAALQAAHGRRIIHRDIKPSNCFRVVDSISEDVIKVLDFGVARVLGGQDEGAWLDGTPEYMAPESFSSGANDASVDVYAVGMLGYHLLTGKLPFSRSSDEFLSQIRAGVVRGPRQAAPRLRIPELADGIIMRALRPSPADRYATIAELGAAIAAAIEPRARVEVVAAGDVSTVDPSVAPVAVPAPRSGESAARATPLWKVALISSGVAAAVAFGIEQWMAQAPARPNAPARPPSGQRARRSMDAVHEPAPREPARRPAREHGEPGIVSDDEALMRFGPLPPLTAVPRAERPDATEAAGDEAMAG